MDGSAVHFRLIDRLRERERESERERERAREKERESSFAPEQSGWAAMQTRADVEAA